MRRHGEMIYADTHSSNSQSCSQQSEEIQVFKMFGECSKGASSPPGWEAEVFSGAISMEAQRG